MNPSTRFSGIPGRGQVLSEWELRAPAKVRMHPVDTFEVRGKTVRTIGTQTDFEQPKSFLMRALEALQTAFL